jgi:zinc protease
MRNLFLLLFISVFGFSQELDLNQKIPFDPTIKKGVLKNGLTYFIKQNKKPENKVDLRLIVKVGSIVENDNEQGLAHFTEHMCFNGTKRFPKNDLVDYLQKMGVKFGADLNAYTSFDETVYFLPIPSDDMEKVKTGLDVLEDWAFNLTMDFDEIDKERGVIKEEYVSRLGADQRMQRDYLPKMLYKSKYPERLPIGTMEVVENFKHQLIVDFYKNWYRPNLMAIVVVGDINPEEMEKLIISKFSKYSNPKKEIKREEYDIPNHKETFVSIVDDEEQAFSEVQILYKDYDKPKYNVTIADFRRNVIKDLFSVMINNRLDEKQNSSNPPYTYGYSYHGGTYSKNKDAFQSFAMTNPDKVLTALQTLLEENQRVKKFGFSDSELQRAKTELLTSIESSFKERDKQESNRFVSRIQNHFLRNSPVTPIEWMYETLKKLLPNVSASEVNALINQYIKEDNRVVIIKLPKKEGIVKPSEAEVLKLINQNFDNITAYQEVQAAESMIRNQPKAGTILSKTTNPKTEEVTLQLSNGAKVTYKVTDFKNDQILMEGLSFGGSNLFTNEEFVKSSLGLSGVAEAGFAGMNKNELNKFMTGKIANVNAYVSSITENISGNCAPKDLETFMQLIYVNFTDVNKDPEAFKGHLIKEKGFYSNMLQMPNMHFQNELYTFLNEGNPRYLGFPTEEKLNAVDYELAYKKYRERFSNASDFHFYFVGNIPEKEFENYVCEYLASLPSNNQSEKAIDLGFRMKKGDIKKVINKGKDPKSNVSIMFYGECQYDDKEARAMRALGEILSIKLIEEIREKESGVYGIGSRGSISKVPYGSYNFSINFPCSPQNVDRLTELSLKELQKIIDNGPTQVDFDKFLEAEKLKFKENLKKNEYWRSNFNSSFINQRPSEDIFELVTNLENIKLQDIQQVAKKYLTKDKVIAYLMPEE